jgi:hypothetical protein
MSRRARRHGVTEKDPPAPDQYPCGIELREPKIFRIDIRRQRHARRLSCYAR